MRFSNFDTFRKRCSWYLRTTAMISEKSQRRKTSHTMTIKYSFFSPQQQLICRSHQRRAHPLHKAAGLPPYEAWLIAIFSIKQNDVCCDLRVRVKLVTVLVLAQVISIRRQYDDWHNQPIASFLLKIKKHIRGISGWSLRSSFPWILALKHIQPVAKQ